MTCINKLLEGCSANIGFLDFHRRTDAQLCHSCVNIGVLSACLFSVQKVCW